MDKLNLVQERVDEYFTTGANNCAMTVLKVLAERFEMPLDPQVVSAAKVMPGAGGVEDLCGLVSGVLMFIGVWGGQQGLHRSALHSMSSSFTKGIAEHFGSIACRDLRDNCSVLAVDVLNFTIPHLEQEMRKMAMTAD